LLKQTIPHAIPYALPIGAISHILIFLLYIKQNPPQVFYLQRVAKLKLPVMDDFRTFLASAEVGILTKELFVIT